MADYDVRREFVDSATGWAYHPWRRSWWLNLLFAGLPTSLILAFPVVCGFLAWPDNDEVLLLAAAGVALTVAVTVATWMTRLSLATYDRSTDTLTIRPRGGEPVVIDVRVIQAFGVETERYMEAGEEMVRIRLSAHCGPRELRQTIFDFDFGGRPRAEAVADWLTKALGVPRNYTQPGGQ